MQTDEGEKNLTTSFDVTLKNQKSFLASLVVQQWWWWMPQPGLHARKHTRTQAHTLSRTRVQFVA